MSDKEWKPGVCDNCDEGSFSPEDGEQVPVVATTYEKYDFHGNSETIAITLCHACYTTLMGNYRTDGSEDCWRRGVSAMLGRIYRKLESMEKEA